jgi:hypothetical protein
VPAIVLTVLVVVITFFAGISLNGTDKILSSQAQAVSSCLNRVNIPLDQMHWVYFPTSASQLHTEENYYFLAGQLISNGVVDASTCPSGGLALNGYANACGMETAKPTVVIIQNMLDESILKAGNEVGVPPVLLKQMIRYESQFWPSYYTQSHFGFGHVTNIGIRNALEWNPDLRAKVCPTGSGTTCQTSFSIADDILKSLVATCPTCENGIDTYSANRSVDILAEVVLGYCYQTAQLVFNATGWYSSNVVDYPTLWKLTLMDYNAGSECVFNATAAAFNRTKGPMKWEDISAHVTGEQCIRGLLYANQITARFYNFPP